MHPGQSGEVRESVGSELVVGIELQQLVVGGLGLCEVLAEEG